MTLPANTSRAKQAGFTAVAVLGVPSLILLLVEGTSSAILVTRDVVQATQAPNAQTRSIAYDSLWDGNTGPAFTFATGGAPACTSGRTLEDSATTTR